MRAIVHHLGNLLRGVKLLAYRMSGIRVGRNTMISLGAKLDVRKGLIEIGDNCLITHGVKILSHDGSLRLIDPDANRSGVVRIGNNVFVGVNAVILPNVSIGDNSIIGAGSVVANDVAPATVVAGNPARKIKRLEGPFAVLNSPD